MATRQLFFLQLQNEPSIFWHFGVWFNHCTHSWLNRTAKTRIRHKTAYIVSGFQQPQNVPEITP